MAGQLFNTKKAAMAYKKKRSKAWKKSKTLESTVQGDETFWRFVAKGQTPKSESEKIDAEIRESTEGITRGLGYDFSDKVADQSTRDMSYASDTMKLIVEGEDPYLGEDWHDPEEASAMRGELDRPTTTPKFQNFKSGGRVRKKKPSGKQYAYGGRVAKYKG
jgi:hypothetical protein